MIRLLLQYGLSLVLLCLLITKVLPGLNLIFCEFQSNSYFLIVIFFVLQGLIFTIKFAGVQGIFFFISLGIGYLPFSSVYIRFKLSILMFFFSYITGSILYLFGFIGHL